MSLSNITSIKIECLEELLHNENIGILSKKEILKQIIKLKEYYKGLIDLEDYYDEEEDDEEDDYWYDDEEDY